MTNITLFKCAMISNWETQAELADGIGISLSALNDKIHGRRGCGFTQSEILAIKNRYKLTPEDTDAIFFAKDVEQNSSEEEK